jgi:hypothetical protein
MLGRKRIVRVFVLLVLLLGLVPLAGCGGDDGGGGGGDEPAPTETGGGGDGDDGY